MELAVLSERGPVGVGLGGAFGRALNHPVLGEAGHGGARIAVGDDARGGVVLAHEGHGLGGPALVGEVKHRGERDAVGVGRDLTNLAGGGGRDVGLAPDVLVLAAAHVISGHAGAGIEGEVGGGPAREVHGVVLAAVLDRLPLVAAVGRAALERHGHHDVLELVLEGAGLPGLGSLGLDGVGADVADGAVVVDADGVGGGRDVLAVALVGHDVPAAVLPDAAVVDGLVVADVAALVDGAGHARVAAHAVLTQEVDVGIAVGVVLGELGLHVKARVLHLLGKVDGVRSGGLVVSGRDGEGHELAVRVGHLGGRGRRAAVGGVAPQRVGGLGTRAGVVLVAPDLLGVVGRRSGVREDDGALVVRDGDVARVAGVRVGVGGLVVVDRSVGLGRVALAVRERVVKCLVVGRELGCAVGDGHGVGRGLAHGKRGALALEVALEALALVAFQCRGVSGDGQGLAQAKGRVPCVQARVVGDVGAAVAQGKVKGDVLELLQALDVGVAPVVSGVPLAAISALLELGVAVDVARANDLPLDVVGGHGLGLVVGGVLDLARQGLVAAGGKDIGVAGVGSGDGDVGGLLVGDAELGDDEGVVGEVDPLAPLLAVGLLGAELKLVACGHAIHRGTVPVTIGVIRPDGGVGGRTCELGGLVARHDVIDDGGGIVRDQAELVGHVGLGRDGKLGRASSLKLPGDGASLGLEERGSHLHVEVPDERGRGGNGALVASGGVNRHDEGRLERAVLLHDGGGDLHGAGVAVRVRGVEVELGASLGRERDAIRQRDGKRVASDENVVPGVAVATVGGGGVERAAQVELGGKGAGKRHAVRRLGADAIDGRVGLGAIGVGLVLGGSALGGELGKRAGKVDAVGGKNEVVVGLGPVTGSEAIVLPPLGGFRDLVVRGVGGIVRGPPLSDVLSLVSRVAGLAGGIRGVRRGRVISLDGVVTRGVRLVSLSGQGSLFLGALVGLGDGARHAGAQKRLGAHDERHETDRGHAKAPGRTATTARPVPFAPFALFESSAQVVAARAALLVGVVHVALVRRKDAHVLTNPLETSYVDTDARPGQSNQSRASSDNAIYLF